MMNKEPKNIRLMLVDDEADFRQTTARVLKRRGFEVIEAGSGEQAIDMIREKVAPDIVVLDLKMGGMDGITTLEEIRIAAPELPVIILTGHGRLDDAVAGIRMKIVDFLQKPVDVEQLAARIRGLLSGDARRTLKERTIGDLMVPAASYRKCYVDQPVSSIVRALRNTMPENAPESAFEHGQRTILVYDRQENFIGPVRISDLIKFVLPSFLESPYSSYFTGMFLAQCKLIGNRPAGELIQSSVRVDIDAPLMEAAHLISFHRLINLPVMCDGKLAGMLRDRDLFLEIARAVAEG